MQNRINPDQTENREQKADKRPIVVSVRFGAVSHNIFP